MPDENALLTVGLKVGTYKCFGSTPQGFEQLLPFNIIIGRNNSGKSALLDLLAYIVTRQSNQMLTIDDKDATILITDRVTQDDIEHVAGNWGKLARLVNRRITWSLLPQGVQGLIAIDDGELGENLTNLWRQVANRKANPLRGYHFKRLTAERDMLPEKAGKTGIETNGFGATSTIHHFLHNRGQDNTVVETTMLNDLNMIFGRDATFNRIDTLDNNDGTCEVYLYEGNKGRIPLSRSGSGLRTLILVLAYLHLIPRLDKADLHTYLFAFEELENNLHPAVQRRLLHFLRDFGQQHGCRFFLTTHSPIEIDYFARDEHAQVLHVTHDQTNATVTTVSAYAHGRHVLDDLDLRASDILQSNGIIWVEGPSDRIYLNKWIELWTNGEYREGAHYQILFYGGKLLFHLDAREPDSSGTTIHLFTTNRNAAVLIDSDRRDSTTAINTTKQRIVDEITSAGGLAWITAGREIENYIPTDLLVAVAHLPAPPETYASVQQVIKENPTSPARLADKMALAQEITPKLTLEHLSTTSDLSKQLPLLVEQIRCWNGGKA